MKVLDSASLVVDKRLLLGIAESYELVLTSLLLGSEVILQRLSLYKGLGLLVEVRMQVKVFISSFIFLSLIFVFNYWNLFYLIFLEGIGRSVLGSEIKVEILVDFFMGLLSVAVAITLELWLSVTCLLRISSL